MYASSTRLGSYKYFPMFWDEGLGFCTVMLAIFCIRCSISFIFGFLGFFYPKAKWVLILNFFQICGFYLILCATLFSRIFLPQSGSWNLMIHLDIRQTTFASLLHWDACCIRPLDSIFGWGTCCFVFSSSPFVMIFVMVVHHTWVHARTLSDDLRVSIFRGTFESYDHWGWVGNLHAYGHSSLDEHG